MSKPIIMVEKLCKHYEIKDEKIRILDDISLQVQKGDMIALLGPSGSGKTTLLNMIGLIDLPSSGNLQVGSYDLSQSAKAREQARRTDVGYVFQQFHLLPQFSALENVCLPLLPFKTVFSVRERASELLERVGLAARMHHLPSELSGGEQQRVSVARALINAPQILLCDEPTGNLDTKNRDSILDLLEELNRDGLTIIIATHDLAVANRCHQQLELQDGHLSIDF